MSKDPEQWCYHFKISFIIYNGMNKLKFDDMKEIIRRTDNTIAKERLGSRPAL